MIALTFISAILFIAAYNRPVIENALLKHESYNVIEVTHQSASIRWKRIVLPDTTLHYYVSDTKR